MSTLNEEKKLDIPEFLKQEPEKIITISEKEFVSKVEKYVRKSWSCGWVQGFKYGIIIMTILMIGVVATVWAIYVPHPHPGVNLPPVEELPIELLEQSLD